MAYTYDIYFQPVPPTTFSNGDTFTFGQARSLGIAGLQKLVNMFAKYLMTPIGTDPMNLTEGTELPSLIGSNVDVADAQEILILAVEKTVKALVAKQRGKGFSDDETLSGASVTEYISIPALPGFSAQIFIENVAGRGLAFILPTLTVST